MTAAKRAYMACAVRRSYGGRANKTGAFRYGDGAPSDEDEAAAFAARLARATMAARHTGNEEAAAVAPTTDDTKDNGGASLRQGIQRQRPSGRAAAASAARRTPATKAAQRTGVNKVAFASTTDNAKDNDIAPHNNNSNDGANNDANDNAKRGTKPRVAKKADEYGARRVRTATTPHDSNEDSNNSTNKAAKPRQCRTARGVYARQLPTRTRWQRDRDSVMAT